MEKRQIRTPKLRHRRETKLGLAPSSDFRWFSSILRHKRTVPASGEQLQVWQAPDRGDRGSLQDRENAVQPTPHGQQLHLAGTTPSIGERLSSETTQGIHANHAATESPALPDTASAGPSTVTEKTKTKLSESEPTQPGLRFAPLTAAPRSKKTPELHTIWDEKNLDQPEGVEQVGARQKPGTATKPSQNNDNPKRYAHLAERSSLNDNPTSDDSRTYTPGNPESGVSRKGPSQDNVS
jgi:hypothetical protein